MNETQYRRRLVATIRRLFPGCHVLRPDPRELQGVPDILILFNNTWAMLEIKMEDDSKRQPNQEYYVEHFGKMSYAAFINPGNEEAVLNDLQSSLGLSWPARIS